MWNKNERSGHVDQAKGTVEQVVGDSTGNETLQAEGTVDETVGKAKTAVGDGRVDAARGDHDADAFETQPYGSALGIIDSSPKARLPWAPKDHGGNPKGIDVRTPATGFDDLHQSFSTTDMGGAGEASDIAPDASPDRDVDD